MDPTRFDSLVRSLAQPASRRRTLGVLAGGALAALAAGGVSEATAKRKHKHHSRDTGGNGHGGPGGNSDCAHFCAAVFGANTPAADQCTSDAARGNPNGVCATCGAAHASSVCCARDANGFCTTYTAVICSCSGTTPDCDASGTCVCNQNSCATGQVCHNGQCVPLVCPGGGDPCLNEGNHCINGVCTCATDIDGSGVCIQGAQCLICASDTDCGPEGVCIQGASCCPGGTACALPCQT